MVGHMFFDRRNKDSFIRAPSGPFLAIISPSESEEDDSSPKSITFLATMVKRFFLACPPPKTSPSWKTPSSRVISANCPSIYSLWSFICRIAPSLAFFSFSISSSFFSNSSLLTALSFAIFCPEIWDSWKATPCSANFAVSATVY